MSTGKKEKKKEFLSVRVSAGVKARLEEIADNNERSLSWVVAKIIDSHLAKAKSDQL